MGAVYRHGLKRLGGQTLGWGLALALVSAGIASFYTTIAKQREGLEALLNSYPPEMLAFFGDATAVFTPAGFLGVELFSLLPLVLGIFAVMVGSGLLAADEENGTLDLFLAHPVGRTKLLFGRLAAYVTAVAAILAIMWIGLFIGARAASMDLTLGELARPFLSIGAVLLVLGTLALALSMLLPSRRSAAMVTGLVLVGSYIATSLARVNTDLQPIARLLPLDYYQGGAAINELNLNWLFGLLAAAAILAALSAWLFQRRDIRVGGEGSWGLPTLRRKSAAAEKQTVPVTAARA
jgi:ABC-2 type transport system permease protein